LLPESLPSYLKKERKKERKFAQYILMYFYIRQFSPFDMTLHQLIVQAKRLRCIPNPII